MLRAAAERWLIVCSMGAGVAVATYAGWSAVVAALILWALAVAWHTRQHARNAAAHKLRHGVPLRQSRHFGTAVAEMFEYVFDLNAPAAEGGAPVASD